jgi:hypothetical protein
MTTADQCNTGAGGVERFDSESKPYAEGHAPLRVGRPAQAVIAENLADAERSIALKGAITRGIKRIGYGQA